jgi:hypothetical protein
MQTERFDFDEKACQSICLDGRRSSNGTNGSTDGSRSANSRSLRDFEKSHGLKEKASLRFC